MLSTVDGAGGNVNKIIDYRSLLKEVNAKEIVPIYHSDDFNSEKFEANRYDDTNRFFIDGFVFDKPDKIKETLISGVVAIHFNIFKELDKTYNRGPCLTLDLETKEIGPYDGSHELMLDEIDKTEEMKKIAEKYNLKWKIRFTD
ncbi:MAG: hypothetical protein ACXACX_09340 [Candidatus Hodarchaeales archaeon]|jgi:hypothetical protein